MAVNDWDARLEASQNDADVLQVARDFLASLDSFEVAALPPSCRPRKLTSANEVSTYAFDLLSCDASPENPATKVISRLAVFFARASNRLARLYAPKRRISDEELGLTKQRR